MASPPSSRAADGGTPDPQESDHRVRRVFLFGSPRSRTTISQNVLAHACNLATMASTNWYLEHRSTWLLNGSEGWSRDRARPYAIERVRAHLLRTTGTLLPEIFRLEEALDLLAQAGGAVGWLEKTPLHVLSVAEIQADIPDARFIHVIREPKAVITSLIRRARDNPAMLGARHQLQQNHNEAVWRDCVRAALAQRHKPRHLLLNSDTFLDDPESVAAQVAAFLHVPYRPPEHPGRIDAVLATSPSRRPWKRDATGPVRRIVHSEPIALTRLDPETETLWAQAQHDLRRTTTPENF